jgi:hypothetical protein
MFENEVLRGYLEQCEVKRQEYKGNRTPRKFMIHNRCKVLRDEPKNDKIEQKQIRAFDILDLHRWKQITTFSSCLLLFHGLLIPLHHSVTIAVFCDVTICGQNTCTNAQEVLD